MAERLVALLVLIVVIGIPAGLTLSKGKIAEFALGVPYRGFCVANCSSQARPPFVVVGTAVLWSEEDAAGVGSLRVPLILRLQSVGGAGEWWGILPNRLRDHDLFLWRSLRKTG